MTLEIELAKKAGARIFVLLMDATDAYTLMAQGHEAGLFTQGTQIIGGGLLSTGIYIHTYIRTCIHAYIHAYTHIQTDIYMHTHIYIYTYICIHTH
jgi:hypothetical protein